MKLNKTKAILDQIQEKYTPQSYVWLFSGGDDSLACGKVCEELLGKIDYAIFCDTGTCIPQTREFVIDTCKAMGIPLIIETPSEKDSYERYVLRFGFPGQNHSQHRVMYRMLKDHSLSRAIAKVRNKRRGYRLALLTGARRDESIRRMGTVKDYDLRGNNVWVNPIADWGKSDIHHYFQDRQIERSIVAKIIGRSGECNCGVYGHPNELKEINTISPDFYTYMKDLECRVKQRGFYWGWGESPPKDWQAVSEGQLQIEGLESPHYSQQMFMCTTCQNNRLYGKSSYDLGSKKKQRIIEEHRILNEACEGNTRDVLLIGKMLQSLERHRFDDNKDVKIRMDLDRLIDEYAKNQ